MGTVNTNIRIDELITQFELMKEQLAAASPVIVTLTGAEGTMTAEQWDAIRAGVESGAPVTVKVSVDGTFYYYLGFYATLEHLEEYDSIIFRSQGNPYSLSMVDQDWQMMEVP